MAELSVADVLSHYGADLTHVPDYGWRSLHCPFHQDRMSSASVNLEKGAFCCHGCGMKGDAISLIKRNEHLDYGGAIEFAQRTFGASVAGVRGPAKEKARRQRWSDRLFA